MDTLLNYAFVNQKEVNGDLYQAYRSTTNPRDCVVIKNKKEILFVDSIKLFWAEIAHQN